jgi:hypothetical protein
LPQAEQEASVCIHCPYNKAGLAFRNFARLM